MEPAAPRLVVGCMTGTSLDGLDAALARITGRGLGMRAELVAHLARPLDDLRGPLARLMAGEPAPPIEYLRLARRLGELHAEAVEDLVRASLPRDTPLSAVVAHGQTIWHMPAEGLSWQLMDPWPIVRRLGAPVCYDLRQADLIAGGEGAPITPLSDWVLFRSEHTHRVVVNLGGVLNVTHLPAGTGPEAVTGGDKGPCNLLLDGLVQRLRSGTRYDADGALAATGAPGPWVAEFLASTTFQRDKASLGREDYNPAFLDALLERRPAGCSDADVLASAADAVAAMVVRHTAPPETGGTAGGGIEVILAGGGALNTYLARRIAELAGPGQTVRRIDELGVPPEAREALGFAVLGALSADGVAATLPAVTGADRPGVAGAWARP